ncbi:hypothetical protein VTO58DRAFT_105130 [Aureobasidium pullulans]|nr:hypothetical protein JADG_000150 [Aureobasidium pullulans]
MDDPLKDISTTRVSDTSAPGIIARMDAPTTDPSTTDTTTPMSDSSTQTPTFFHLPLEIRYQIYNQLLHSHGNNTVYMEITLNPTSCAKRRGSKRGKSRLPFPTAEWGLGVGLAITISSGVKESSSAGED